MKPQGHIPASASPSAHEAADLNMPLIVRIAAVVAPTLALLILAVALLFHHFNRTYRMRTSEAAPVVTTADLPPAPRLQMDPAQDLRATRAKEDLHLNRYAWTDRPQGIAQIPIERAMVLWVKTYSPPPSVAVSPATKAVAAPTELQMRRQKAEKGAHAP